MTTEQIEEQAVQVPKGYRLRFKDGLYWLEPKDEPGGETSPKERWDYRLGISVENDRGEACPTRLGFLLAMAALGVAGGLIVIVPIWVASWL